MFNADGPDLIPILNVGTPWALLPVCGRPIVEYWIELASTLGIKECLVVADEGIEQLESFLGTGSRWGVHIRIAFSGMAQTETFLREAGNDLRLHIEGPLFPKRTGGTVAAGGGAVSMTYRGHNVAMSLHAGAPDSAVEQDFESAGIIPFPLDSTRRYYALSMDMLKYGMSGYLTPGYASGGDGSFVGMDTLTPASCELKGPLVIGNRCRFGTFTTVGPNAIVADDVVVDSRTVITNAIVLKATYIGRNLDITGRIILGNRIIDPLSGESVELSDPWIVRHIPPKGFPAWLHLFFGQMAALLFLLLLLPLRYLIGFPLRLGGRIRTAPFSCPDRFGSTCTFVRAYGEGLRFRLYTALLLDLTPQLLLAVAGRLYLCGTDALYDRCRPAGPPPQGYYPGVFNYSGARGMVFSTPDIADIDRRYYAATRSPAEDLRILFRFLGYRILGRRAS